MKKTNPFLVSLAIFFSLLVFISNANLSSAQSPTPTTSVKPSTSDKYAVLAPLPCIEGNGIECKDGNGALQKEVDFKTYVQYTINLLIALSAVTAVVMIVWGGIEYMFNNSFTSKKMGLERAQNAVYGLLLVLSSYIILRTIDPRLVEIPNTLVPQLVVEEWLSKDVNLEFLAKLQDQVNKYRIREVEIAEELSKIRSEKTKKIAAILEIEKEIEQLQTETPDASAKFNQLNVQKAKILEEIRKLEVDFQKKITKSAINQTVISNLQDSAEVNLDNPDIITEVQAKLEASKNKIKDIDDYKNSGEKLINQNGEYDNSEISEQAIFGKSLVNVNNVDLIIRSATIVNSGGGYMGAGAVTKLKIVLADGSSKEFTSTAEAKDVVQKELDKEKIILESISDKEAKNKLEERIKEVQSELDLSPSFNKKFL